MHTLPKEQWTPATPLDIRRQRRDAGTNDIITDWIPVKFVGIEDGHVVVKVPQPDSELGDPNPPVLIKVKDEKVSEVLRVRYAEPGLADVRYGQAIKCTWHGPLGQALLEVGRGYVCPDCRGDVYCWENEAAFLNNVSIRGAGDPEYARWVASWREEKCRPTVLLHPPVTDIASGDRLPVADKLWDWREEFAKWRAAKRTRIVSTTTKCRIDRVLFKTAGGRLRAEFNCHLPQIGYDSWRAAQALEIRDGVFQIMVFSGILEPEQAAALGVSLSMALDWISEAKGTSSPIPVEQSAIAQ